MDAGRILIVDDSELVRAVLMKVLEAAGYRADEAVNGHEALTALRHNPLPDVILLDIEMPNMNGVAFRLHQLRQPRMAGVPVIVHSLFPDSYMLGSIMQASAYLTKPANRAALLATVQQVISATQTSH